MKKIMFCGGGSAGHVIPNIALCEQLKGSFDTCYIGTDSIEKDICRNYGVRFNQFDGVKLVRGKILCNLQIPCKLIKSVAECKKIIKREKPDLLFCKGGYASYPPAVAASSLHIPVLTHESDLSPGLANRIIAGKCRRVLTAFPSTADKIRNGLYAGTPMRSSLFGRDKLLAKSSFGFDMRPVVLVFGGGSGSAKINGVIRQIVARLCRNYNVLHICGKGNVVENNIYGYKQVEFCSDMGLVYACADYAVSRCGSNAANELVALKIPTLFIPLENRRSRGDQIANAEYFYGLGLCRILREGDLNADSLKENLELLIKDDKIKTALEHYSTQRGNQFIINEIKAALR